MKKRIVIALPLLVAVVVLLLIARGNRVQNDPDVGPAIRAAVEDYIQQEETQRGGFFLRGPDDAERRLQFDYVHEGVEDAGVNQYVVCVDFLDHDDRRLDVDFYLASDTSGGYEVKQIKVHKIDGVEQE